MKNDLFQVKFKALLPRVSYLQTMENNAKQTQELSENQHDPTLAAAEVLIHVVEGAGDMPPAEDPAESTGPEKVKGIDPTVAEGNSLAFLKSLAEASAVFVAFTFIIGWSYLAAYYNTFGLNPLELDLPLPVVCTTAVYVLFNSGWWLLVGMAALWLVWTVSGHHLKGLWRGLTAVVLTLLLFVASYACVSLGRRQANEDMLIDSSELPNVAFSSKLPKADQPNCVDHETYGSLDCKLLLHSKGIYYFFTPIPSPQNALIDVGSLNVYTLADSDVTGVHISRGLERNAREK